MAAIRNQTHGLTVPSLLKNSAVIVEMGQQGAYMAPKLSCRPPKNLVFFVTHPKAPGYSYSFLFCSSTKKPGLNSNLNLLNYDPYKSIYWTKTILKRLDHDILREINTIK